MRTAVAVMILALIALIYFNPGMEEFSLYVEAQSERLLLEETGDNALGRALSGIGSSLAGAYIDRITDRRNYIVFSVYTIDLDGPEEEGDEWRFVGIGGHFIETSSPESLKER